MKMASTSQLWTVGVCASYVLCYSLFPLALKRIPLGVAYAIWSGVGTAATAAISASAFGESMSAKKCLSILVIIAGVAGLNLEE